MKRSMTAFLLGAFCLMQPVAAAEKIPLEEMQSGKFLLVSFFAEGSYKSVDQEKFEMMNVAGGGELNQFMFHVGDKTLTYLHACNGGGDIYDMARQQLGTRVQPGKPAKINVDCETESDGFKAMSSSTGFITIIQSESSLQVYVTDFDVRRDESRIGTEAENYKMTGWGGGASVSMFSVQFEAANKDTGLRPCKVVAGVVQASRMSMVHHADQNLVLGSSSVSDRELTANQDGAECGEYAAFMSDRTGIGEKTEDLPPPAGSSPLPPSQNMPGAPAKN